jgi:hypothetical protein
VSSEDHGPTCAESPSDHNCGYSRRPDAEPDQGVTWDQWDRIQSEKLQRIVQLHVKTDAGSGATTGFCAECDRAWPCQTVHVANGWGDGEDTCYTEGWCSHANVKVPVLYGEKADL